MKPATQSNDLLGMVAFSLTGLIIGLVVTFAFWSANTTSVLAYLD